MMASGGGMACQLIERQVGERVGLQVAPDVFGGVELGCIRWKKHRAEAMGLSQERLHLSAPVSQKAVPEENAWAGQLPQQLG